MKHERKFTALETAPIINALVEVRLAWGLERAQVAGRCGIDPRKLRQYELGIHEPHLRFLRAWAGALGYDLALRPKS